MSRARGWLSRGCTPGYVRTPRWGSGLFVRAITTGSRLTTGSRPRLLPIAPAGALTRRGNLRPSA
jgi:hypothetical protein